MNYASIDEFVAAQTPPVAEQVSRLRALVTDADPRLKEIVKWNSPSYTLDGEDRLTITVSRSGAVLLILHRGVSAAGVAPVVVDDPEGVLKWHSDIRASLDASADATATRDVIRSWLGA